MIIVPEGTGGVPNPLFEPSAGIIAVVTVAHLPPATVIGPASGPALVEVAVTQFVDTVFTALLSVMLNVAVHGAPGANVGIVNVTLLAPATGTKVAPGQVVEAAGGVATTTPGGNVSVKPTVVRFVTEFGLVSVIITVELPPGGTLPGLIVFVPTGGPGGIMPRSST